jgi:hypothetical protein
VQNIWGTGGRHEGVSYFHGDEKGKDLARLCFVSDDPDLYHNPDAIEIEPLPEPEKPKVPALRSEPPSNLPLREGIAFKRLGELEWAPDKGWHYCTCPGKHLHTNQTKREHTWVSLNGSPTLYCHHDACRLVVEAFNALLRSEIGKAEYQANTDGMEAPPGEKKPLSPRVEAEEPEPVELPPPPAPYVAPPLDLLPEVLQKFIRVGAKAD